MEHGDLVFVRGTSLLSKVIKFFDKGEFTHVAIILDNKHVIDSQYPSGVRIRHFRFKDYEVVQADGDMDKALSFIGYKYDFIQFLWYGFKYGDKVWNNPNQLICSELIAHYLLNNEYLNLSPNELYTRVKGEMSSAN